MAEQRSAEDRIRLWHEQQMHGLARKKRRCARIARRLGVLCCGLVIGIVVTLLVTMTCTD